MEHGSRRIVQLDETMPSEWRRCGERGEMSFVEGECKCESRPGSSLVLLGSCAPLRKRGIDLDRDAGDKDISIERRESEQFSKPIERRLRRVGFDFD